MQRFSKSARQDDSLYSFRNLISLGYTHGVWTLHETHSEYDICDSLDGNIFDLNKLISDLKYSAPIFETAHVNCKCRLICYSKTDKTLEHELIDWRGESEIGRVTDKKDKKERSKDFYRLYDAYRQKFDAIKNDKYLTGSDSNPEIGIYTFNIVLDESYYYNPASKQKISDEILDIILEQADKYSLNIEDSKLSGAEYEVQLEHPLSIYDFSKKDLMDITWTLEERREELTEVMHELDDITNFLKTTQNKINELLINYEQNMTVPQEKEELIPQEEKIEQEIPTPVKQTEPTSDKDLERAVEQNKPNITEPTTDKIKSFEDIPKLPEDTEIGIDNEEEIT